MICPKCGASKMSVDYVRHRPEGIRRVRRCEKCKRRFVTLEKLAGK